MDVFEGLEELVDDVTAVNWLEDLGADGDVQVRVHVFEHHVEVVLIVSRESFQEANYVGVFEVLEECDLGKGGVSGYLAVGSLSVGGIIERIKGLLECDYLTGFEIGSLPDDAVGALAQVGDNLVALQDVRVYLVGHDYL